MKEYGIKKPEIQQLPRVRERMTFLYLERCKISRTDGAIKVMDDQGIVYVPAASISTLLLGPGTDISHRGLELIGDMGVTVLWVGEAGVRYYAHGRALSSNTKLLLKQAELVSNSKKHVAVARKMYQLRFPDEDVSGLTMQQLRGREGSRIRGLYRENSKKWGVEWTGRDYKPDQFEDSNVVNQALTAGNICLYGLAHAVISALGCSPGLGFVHVGHELSFVYDVADLYKGKTSIPLAFELATSAEADDNVGSLMRHKMRDLFRSEHILEQMVKDILYLFESEEDQEELGETLVLWDVHDKIVPHGQNHADFVEGE